MHGLKSVHSLLLIAVGLFVGCGGGPTEPELGVVVGKITVDGAPGADLDITFEPQKGGSGSAKDVGASSTARTEPDGSYELTYKGVKKGAVVGKHLIRITSAAGGGPAGGETGAVATFEIPAKYNTESDMIREVKGGENEIDVEVATK